MYALVKGSVVFEAETLYGLANVSNHIDIKKQGSSTIVEINGNPDTISYNYEWSRQEIMREVGKRVIQLMVRAGWKLYKRVY